MVCLEGVLQQSFCCGGGADGRRHRVLRAGGRNHGGARRAAPQGAPSRDKFADVFRAAEERAVAVQRQLTDRAILYTRHCDDGRRKPYAIPDREMNVFMLVASSGETGLEYFGDEDRKFVEGQRVRVTDGPFRGAEGSIQRIHGDRRLLVSIRGICAVATTYIPKAFLEEIN